MPCGDNGVLGSRAAVKSWLEIDGHRLGANFRAVQAAAGSAYQVLAVIKADAYGHGAALCGPVLARAGARWLGVADAEEGVAVREALEAAGLASAGIRLLVMCGFAPGDVEALITHELTPVVWTAEHLNGLQLAADKLDRRVPVHIEVDTGMARQGVPPGLALAALFDVLHACSRLRYEGLFTHLSSSETTYGEQTSRQLHALGVALSTQPQSSLLLPDLLHLANTSAVDEGSTLPWLRARAEEAHAQPMVRTGLAIFGHALPLVAPAVARSPEDAQTVPGKGRLQPLLQSVATWNTRILGLREIERGATVGYGASFVAAHRMRLALLPVGYADGFRREASSGIGNGWVTITGLRAPVVGRVSMNLTVVDVTAIPACREGEEVVLLGEGVSAEDHARWCGTIPYEILCAIRAHRRLV